MRTILIGIDDTDNATSPGTGRMARNLCAQLTRQGAKSLGITRHQFLVDDAIPYTSHNSGACIALETSDGIEQADFAFDFVARESAEGADPGVCIAFIEDVPEKVSDFAVAAQERVLAIEESFALAEECGVRLRGLGGNSQGVIGALASVGLRARGNDGRFIDMPGLRELPRHVDARTYEQLGIEVRYENDLRRPRPDDIYDTMNWVRPRLVNGRAVLIVEWSEKENAWIPIDRRKNKRSQHSAK